MYIKIESFIHIFGASLVSEGGHRREGKREREGGPLRYTSNSGWTKVVTTGGRKERERGGGMRKEGSLSFASPKKKGQCVCVINVIFLLRHDRPLIILRLSFLSSISPFVSSSFSLTLSVCKSYSINVMEIGIKCID